MSNDHVHPLFREFLDGLSQGPKRGASASPMSESPSQEVSKMGAFTYLRNVESEPAVRIMEWIGGWRAPERNSELTVVPAYVGFHAYWEPGYCGCDDCQPIVGHGKTEEEAIADYWREWEAR